MKNSLDLVVFINGLPIITFELKNELTKQNVKDAIKQYKTSRDSKEELFRLGRCMVHFAVDTEQVWMTTHLKNGSTYFLPFNKGYNNGAGNPPNDKGIKTDYLWKEILTKDSLTNIIQNYVTLFEEEVEKILPDGKIKKEKVKKLIFPRYLTEKQQDDFRAECKTYVRLYVFLAQIVPFINPYLERLYLFLNHLQNKLGRQREEDLAQGILDNIDMENLRYQLEATTNIILQQGDELKPIPTEMRTGAAEPEMEYLSNVVKAFNDRFGTTFTNEDKVKKMTEDLMQDVAHDNEFVNAFKHSDEQNARITFEDVLKRKLIDHIETNFEVFKEYQDNKEFRDFFAGTMFRLMQRDFMKYNTNK